MHDPMVVVFDLHVPIPARQRYKELRQGPRWTVGRRTYTSPDPEWAGRPIYPWWRAKAWEPRFAGRHYGWRGLCTIWHHEPKGRDSGTVCKGMRGSDLTAHNVVWAVKHVRHLSVQVGGLQALRARLFDRCELCGRKGRPNISHQWDGKKVGWRKWRSRTGLYHQECSGLIHVRRTVESDEALIRHLFAALAVHLDVTERELLEMLTDPKKRGMEFHESFRLTRLLGYERDENYDLVKEPERG